MGRITRVSIILLLIAALGVVGCERPKADVVGTATPLPAVETGENGEDVDGEEVTEPGQEEETAEPTTPTETEEEPVATTEPGATTVTVQEPTPTTDGAEPTEAEPTETPADGEAATETQPTATPAPEPTAAAGTGQRIHVVQRGEWIYSIARQYPGVSPQDIIRANNLRSPSTIYAGQELIIPGGDGSTDGQQTHIVQRGETLIGIARRYDTTIDAIRRANNLSGDRIYVGQRLIIP